jgi:hypothetical protein
MEITNVCASKIEGYPDLFKILNELTEVGILTPIIYFKSRNICTTNRILVGDILWI